MNDLTGLVRRSLDERSRDMPAAPPSWARISAGLTAVRRRRRRRQAGLVGAVAAIAALGAVAGGLTPTALLRTEPATPDGGKVRSGAVFGNRTVGSLARDKAFLAGLRREVVTAGLDFGEATPQVFRPEDVLVPFAGDVGDLRVALLEVQVGNGDGVHERFVWLSARKDAPAADLARHPYEIDEAGPVASLWLPTPDGEPARDGIGALVVLSAGRKTGDLQIAGSQGINEKGRVDWVVQQAQPLSPGHWEAAVPWRLKDVTAGWWAMPEAAEWTELALPYRDDSGFGFVSDQALHGGATARGTAVAKALADAQAAARVAVEGSLRTLLWTGTVDRSTLSVVSVTVPTGAHVITVDRVLDRAVVPTDVVTAPPILRPAGPLEKVCIAVPTEDPRTHAAALLVLGPVGAERAVVGSGSPALLRDEAAVVDPAPAGARVDFLDAAGTSLCSTAVGATTDRFVPHA